MEDGNNTEIINMALRIKELKRCFDDSIEHEELREITKVIMEYLRIRRGIIIHLACSSVVETISDTGLRKIVQDISQQNYSEMDKVAVVLVQMTDSNFNLEELDNIGEDEIDKLGQDEFYSWFSHYEYIQGHIEIGPLVVGVKVPSLLKCFIREAKDCYAFQQYRAVFALCRSILESCVRHICAEMKLLPEGDVNNYNAVSCLRDVVLRNEPVLRKRFKNLYQESSSIIHAHKDDRIENSETQEILRNTLVLVQDIYTATMPSGEK